jgi:hypothetical protein
MVGEIQHHRILEAKQNAAALDPIEILIFVNDSKLKGERLRTRLIDGAMLAMWAHELNDDVPNKPVDIAFKIMETEFLGRLSREF